MTHEEFHQLDHGDTITYTRANGCFGEPSRTVEDGPYQSVVVSIEDFYTIHVRDDGFWGMMPLFAVCGKDITAVQHRRQRKQEVG